MIGKLFILAIIFLVANVSYGQNRNVSKLSPADSIRALDNDWLAAYYRMMRKRYEEYFPKTRG